MWQDSIKQVNIYNKHNVQCSTGYHNGSKSSQISRKQETQPTSDTMDVNSVRSYT